VTENKTDQPPCLLFANSRGEILEYDGLNMAGSSAGNYFLPQPEELIPLPEGSELFVLPGRLPVGIEADGGEPALLAENPYDPEDQLSAVAAFMAPAHTAVYTPSAKFFPGLLRRLFCHPHL
jgi:hypothetical protein